MLSEPEALFNSPQSPITLTFDGCVKQGNHRLEVARQLIAANKFPLDVNCEVPVLVDKSRKNDIELAAEVVIANRKGAADNEVNIILHGQSPYSTKIVKPIFKVFNDKFVKPGLMSKGNAAKLVLPLAAMVYENYGENLTAADFYTIYKSPECKDAVVLLSIKNINDTEAKEMAERISPALENLSAALKIHQKELKLLYKNCWTIYYCLTSFAIQENPSVKEWAKIFKILSHRATDIVPMFQGKFLNDPAATGAAIECLFKSVISR